MLLQQIVDRRAPGEHLRAVEIDAGLIDRKIPHLHLAEVEAGNVDQTVAGVIRLHHAFAGDDTQADGVPHGIVSA